MDLAPILYPAPPRDSRGIALTADNVEIDNFVCRGTGIVLDPDLGLVLTDRTTVPQSLGDAPPRGAGGGGVGLWSPMGSVGRSRW